MNSQSSIKIPLSSDTHQHIPDILDNVDIHVFNENMKLNTKALEKEHLAKIFINYFFNYY